MAVVASDISIRTEELVDSVEGNKENEGDFINEEKGPTTKAGKRSPKSAAAKGSKSPTNATAEENPNSPTAAEKKAAKDNAVTAQLTKTKMCAFFSRGRCASNNCRYAHCAEELRTLPNLQKTKLCRAFLQGGCTDEDCPFAHGEQDLRVTEGIYKTQICNFYERGYCKKGDRCNHAHGMEDLRPCTPSTKSSSVTGEGFCLDKSDEKKPQDENATQQQSSAPKPKSGRNPLPLAELLLDDNHDYSIHGAPTPTKSPMGPLAMHQSMTPLGVGQTPECHWAATLPPSFGQMHPMSPAGLNPMSPTGYMASPLGIPSPSPLDMFSMLPREPLDVLLSQSQANPQSGTPGMGHLAYSPTYDPALLGAPSSMTELMATQQYRNEANQALLQQQKSMPLDERLASLDACVRDLAADVRNLQAPPATTSSRTSAAPAPTQLFRDTANTPKETTTAPKEVENTQAAQPDKKSFRI